MPAGGKDEIRLEGLEKPESKVMEEPMVPETPLSKSEHFQSDERVSNGMQAPGNPLGGRSEAESYGRQDVDNTFDMFKDVSRGRRWHG